jgi:DNA-binding transcriptional LysR family regulator
MIEPDQLNVFLRAAETLNFSETAKQLHVSQPTVSKRIQDLERGLKVTLFERSPGGLRLTDAGKTLQPWARKLIHQMHVLEDMMASLQTEVSGNLNIACSTTAGKYILPQLAARFRHRYPRIHVSILSCTSENVALRLLEGEAHLGVVSREISESGLESQEFFEDVITLTVPSDHPWVFRDTIKPEDLLGEPIIMREPTSGTRRVLLLELAKHDITLDDLNVFLELGNAEAIVRMVSEGYGISFVSTLAMACPLERGNVVNIPIEDFDLRRKIYMVRKSLDLPYRPQEAFWSFVHDPSNDDLYQLA